MATDRPIDLDTQRGMAAQRATDIRRLLATVQADQAQLRLRQAELELQLLAAPATGWPEAAGKARYLLNVLAESPSGIDPRRQKLIKAVLEDFDRLSQHEE